MPYAELPDVRLYYEHGGSGPRLLFVNGTGTDLRRQPSPLTWPFASDFELLVYDHRGLGRSEPADPDRQPTMADFALDALGLCAQLGWDRFAVLGVSFGGMVAQEIAIRGGDRVQRLVLACTSSGGAGGASYPLQETFGMSPAARAERMPELMDTRAATDPAVGERLRAMMQAAAAPGDGDGDGGLTPGLARQLEARRLHDTYDRLDRIVVPTLVAAGRYDGIAPLANSEAIAARIPGARLDVFDGGHVFFFEDPSAWRAISAFLLEGAELESSDLESSDLESRGA
jgi:3-oxoadipate enol-lactonase